MRIGLIRRGFSASGGAESYLRRFAQGLYEAGHEIVVFGSPGWPAESRPRGEFHVIGGGTPEEFDQQLAAWRPRQHCELLFSLERVSDCDVYRAGDGVHAAWLRRRAKFEPFWKKWLRGLGGKHTALLRLEKVLFSASGARHVIANSALVKNEIIRHYNYPAEQISVIPNGLPASSFGFDPGMRAAARRDLKAGPEEVLALFAGSGWERKGLALAIKAVEQVAGEGRDISLLVAGKGSPNDYRGARASFLGEVRDVRPLYMAADIFVLPTYYDPFSNASLEALGAGLPLVTTRANGCSEIIRPGEHGEVLEDDADLGPALVAALRSWLDPQKRERSRPRIAGHAAQFTIELNVTRTLDILRSLPRA